MSEETVHLVPWDPEDEQHYQRMYDQRVGCGWRKDEVDEWKQKQLRGTKVHYWIVSLFSFFFFFRDRTPD